MSLPGKNAAFGRGKKKTNKAEALWVAGSLLIMDTEKWLLVIHSNRKPLKLEAWKLLQGQAVSFKEK